LGGGKLTFKPGIYIINGMNLLATGNYAQIVLPNINANLGTTIRIEFEGLGSTLNSPVGNLASTGKNSAVLWGTQIGATAASNLNGLIGAYGSTPYEGKNFTSVSFCIKNMTIFLPVNSNMAALNLIYCLSCEIENVYIMPGSESWVVPTNENAGIITPDINNSGMISIKNCEVMGMWSAYQVFEHARLDNCVAVQCFIGLYIGLNWHGVSAGYLSMETVVYPITFFGGLSAFTCELLDLEHAASGIWSTAADIYDPSNYGNGAINYWSVLGGSGISNTFTKSGGANVYCRQLGTSADLPPGPLASLPYASAVPGVRTLVTNSSQAPASNFGVALSVVAGTHTVPVYSDGTNWIIG
jgi:hypothetical protein